MASVIEKRLQTRTSVMGADPSLKRITDKFMTFIDALSNEEAELSTAAAHALNYEIDRYEVVAQRVQTLSKTCDAELKQYKASQAQLEASVEPMRNDVVQLKKKRATE